jgi:hypothetical protein
MTFFEHIARTHWKYSLWYKTKTKYTLWHPTKAILTKYHMILFKFTCFVIGCCHVVHNYWCFFSDFIAPLNTPQDYFNCTSLHWQTLVEKLISTFYTIAANMGSMGHDICPWELFQSACHKICLLNGFQFELSENYLKVVASKQVKFCAILILVTVIWL